MASLRAVQLDTPQSVILGAGDSGDRSRPFLKDVLISWEQGTPTNKQWGGQQVLSTKCGREEKARDGRSRDGRQVIWTM